MVTRPWSCASTELWPIRGLHVRQWHPHVLYLHVKLINLECWSWCSLKLLLNITTTRSIIQNTIRYRTASLFCIGYFWVSPVLYISFDCVLIAVVLGRSKVRHLNPTIITHVTITRWIVQKCVKIKRASVPYLGLALLLYSLRLIYQIDPSYWPITLLCNMKPYHTKVFPYSFSYSHYHSFILSIDMASQSRPQRISSQRHDYLILNSGYEDNISSEDRYSDFPSQQTSFSDAFDDIQTIPSDPILPSESASKATTSQPTIPDPNIFLQPSKLARKTTTKWIWDHFNVTLIDEPWINCSKKKILHDHCIQCKICDWETRDSARDGSTYNMESHLRKHAILAPLASTSSSISQLSIAQSFNKKT